MRIFLISAIVLAPILAFAQEAPSETRQRTACIADAFRLCAASIPDKVAIRACLGAHHEALSMACREVYDASIRAGQ